MAPVKKVHQHKRIYHRGNIKLNVWWESYFYPQKLLFAAIKEITILFSTHWQKLWKSGEEDWQTAGDSLVMSRNSSRIKASEKTQGRLLLSYKNPDFFSGLSELYRIFSKMTEFMGVRGVFYQFCLFICCTEDHTWTVVNNGTCVLSAHTANWCQRSFIRVFFVSASVLSMDRCYKLFLP